MSHQPRGAIPLLPTAVDLHDHSEVDP
jgi:hypothetical protein